MFKKLPDRFGLEFGEFQSTAEVFGLEFFKIQTTASWVWSGALNFPTLNRPDEVFGCMKRAGLKCKPSKCEILRDSIKYLGRMVDRHGVRPDPEAVEAVLTWKAPRTDTQLLSFLEFANY